MSKTLRITFSGICTRAPGYPRNGEQEPEKVYVLMPAARDKERSVKDNDGEIRIGRHHAFIYAPVSIIAAAPEPTFPVDDEKFGLCHVYLIDHARLTFDPPPSNKITHYRSEFDIGVRPGPAGVASEGDIRWLLDMRDLMPADSCTLKPSVDPRRPEVEESVSAVVELAGGTIRANFPCKTVQPQSFRPKPLVQQEPQERVIATEFVVEMEYPDETATVTLNAVPLRSNAAVLGLPGSKLTMRWGARPEIDLRIGNDTVEEIEALQTIKRCNSRPIPVDRDNDFALHFNLLNIVGDPPRPLPFNGTQQTQHNGCATAAAATG